MQPISTAFIEQLHKTMYKQTVQDLAREVIVSQYSIKQLIDLCLARKTQVAFRAAWVLEQICIEEFETFFPHFFYFAEKFVLVKNPSVKRHFGKILFYTLQQRTEKKQLEKWITTDSEAVAQTLFEWLIDHKTRPAVKVWCMDILVILSKQYAWISEELTPTIESQMTEASAGFRVRGKKILKGKK